MEFCFERWIHRGPLSPYYLYMAQLQLRSRAVARFG